MFGALFRCQERHKFVTHVLTNIRWGHTFDHRPVDAPIKLDASLQSLGAIWGTRYMVSTSPWVILF